MNDRNERFDDFLNDCYSTITVVGYDYDPADALYRLDPIAYHEELNNFVDSLCQDGDHSECDDCGNENEDDE